MAAQCVDCMTKKKLLLIVGEGNPCQSFQILPSERQGTGAVGITQKQELNKYIFANTHTTKTKYIRVKKIKKKLCQPFQFCTPTSCPLNGKGTGTVGITQPQKKKSCTELSQPELTLWVHTAQNFVNPNPRF